MRPTIGERTTIRHVHAPFQFRRAGEPPTGRSAWQNYESRTCSEAGQCTLLGGGRHVETDGGAMDDDDDDDDTAFTTYTSDDYRYRIKYPAGWAAETDPPGGMFFSASNGSSASAFVFVDDETEGGVSLAEYVDDFFCELAADEYIHDLERQTERTTTLPGGHSGTVVEYTYTDDAPCEQWCCTYLFAIVDEIGYIVGVEWEATEAFAARAMRIIDSFALVGDTNSNHQDAAGSRSPKQRLDDES